MDCWWAIPLREDKDKKTRLGEHGKEQDRELGDKIKRRRTRKRKGYVGRGQHRREGGQGRGQGQVRGHAV